MLLVRDQPLIVPPRPISVSDTHGLFRTDSAQRRRRPSAKVHLPRTHVGRRPSVALTKPEPLPLLNDTEQ